MGQVVYDVYGGLLRPPTLLAGRHPVLGTVGTCEETPMSTSQWLHSAGELLSVRMKHLSSPGNSTTVTIAKFERG